MSFRNKFNTKCKTSRIRTDICSSTLKREEKLLHVRFAPQCVQEIKNHKKLLLPGKEHKRYEHFVNSYFTDVISSVIK
jgi:hypothetical protein